jgi:glycosyltransferase involved in cell wall biosynthesis
VIEAMSFGLPVVATRWRGLIEIIEDGVTGYLIPIKDEVSIAERLAHLIENPHHRWSMGEAGRARYLNRFSLEQFHRSFHGVFVDQVAQLARTRE